jgi:hypothetical protein
MDRVPVSTCGLSVPTTSGALPVSKVTSPMTSGLSSANCSIAPWASRSTPPTSRMLRSTGSDGVSGTSATSLAAGAASSWPAFGGLQAVRNIPRAATPATRWSGLAVRMRLSFSLR